MIKIITLFVTLTLYAFSAPLATITKIEGNVKSLPCQTIKKHTAKEGEILLAGDKLITYKDTKVMVELLDKSQIILNENSQMTFVSLTSLEQSSGEIYYNIQKRTKSRGLKVTTPFSIIGIKGTEFIVNSSDISQIALNEGLIAIESINANFELHKKQMLDKFNAYKQKQDKGFEEYKNSTNDEVISYVKAFNLEASHILNFSDAQSCKKTCEKHVSEERFNKEIEALFDAYQRMLTK